MGLPCQWQRVEAVICYDKEDSKLFLKKYSNSRQIYLIMLSTLQKDHNFSSHKDLL